MRDKLKQYGILNFLKRSFIFILRKIGIQYNKWLICHQKINLATLPDIIIENKFIYREITYNDFLNSSKFYKTKLNSFSQRFKSNDYYAYGVFCGSDLAYYCWISLSDFQFSNDDYKMDISENEGLLFDAFCFPEYRGNNLHNFMNIYRLKKLIELKKTTALVILLNENTPARKSQKKARFICEKQIITINIFGYKYNTLKNKIINL